MYPHTHVLFPLFIGELLVKLGYVNQDFVIAAVLVGVFVDIDHPLKHFLLTGELSPRKAWNAGVVKHEEDRTFIHHKEGILFITILHLAFLFYQPYWTLAVALGYYSHMLLDHISLKYGFIDNMTPTKYAAPWKPVSFTCAGLIIKLAKQEIVLDVLLLVGLFLI